MLSNRAPNLALEIAGPIQSFEFGLGLENRKRILPDDNAPNTSFEFFDRRLLNTVVDYRFYVVKPKKWKAAAGLYIGPSGLLVLEVSSDDNYFTEFERRFGAAEVPEKNTIHFLGLGGIAGVKFPIIREKVFLDLQYSGYFQVMAGEGTLHYAIMDFNLSYRF